MWELVEANNINGVKCESYVPAKGFGWRGTFLGRFEATTRQTNSEDWNKFRDHLHTVDMYHQASLYYEIIRFNDLDLIVIMRLFGLSLISVKEYIIDGSVPRLMSYFSKV